MVLLRIEGKPILVKFLRSYLEEMSIYRAYT